MGEGGRYNGPVSVITFNSRVISYEAHALYSLNRKTKKFGTYEERKDQSSNTGTILSFLTLVWVSLEGGGYWYIRAQTRMTQSFM